MNPAPAAAGRPKAAVPGCVKKPRSGCDCLTGSIDHEQLDPGESAELKIEISAHKRKGDVREKLAAGSNDAEGPAMVTVWFVVPPPIRAEPQKLCFGIVPPGTTVTKRVKLIAREDVQTKAVYAVCSYDRIVARVVQPRIAPSVPGELEIEVRAPDEPGTYRQRVQVATGAAERVTIPVILCVSPVEVTPERLDIGQVAPGQDIPQALTVSLPEGVTLKSASAWPKHLQAHVSKGKALGARTVGLSVKPNALFDPIGGEIRMEVADASGKAHTVAVPFYGLLAEPSRQ